MRNFPLIKFLFVFSVSISIGIYFELTHFIFTYLFFFTIIAYTLYELLVSNKIKYKRTFSELFIVLSILETILIYIFTVSILISIRFKKNIFYGLSFLIFSILFLLNIIEDYRLKDLKRIIVYNIPDHFGMDLINGPNHYFIGDSALIHNDEKLLFYVKHNWHELALKPTVN